MRYNSLEFLFFPAVHLHKFYKLSLVWSWSISQKRNGPQVLIYFESDNAREHSIHTCTYTCNYLFMAFKTEIIIKFHSLAYKQSNYFLKWNAAL
jgi:hypothetical protein